MGVFTAKRTPLQIKNLATATHAGMFMDDATSQKFSDFFPDSLPLSLMLKKTNETRCYLK